MVDDELLAAIAADVDAIEPRLVYADWLQQAGDPRGELALVEHALARWPGREMLRQRRDELVRIASADVLRGVQANVLAAWWLGFVDELLLHRKLIHRLRQQPAWLDHPALRFVRRLQLPATDVHVRAWEVVAAWRQRGSVRALHHGTVRRRIAPETIAVIAEQLPRLVELDLRSTDMPELAPLARLPVTRLRLELSTLDARGVAELLAMPWRLVRLTIHGHCYGGAALLAPLLTGDRFAELRELELYGPPPLDVIDQLALAGRLTSLDVLSLRLTRLDDGERARLEGHRHALATIRLDMPHILRDSEIGRRAEVSHVLTELLHRHEDALAVCEADDMIGVDRFSGALRIHARALREIGDQARTCTVFDRILRRAHRLGRGWFDNNALELVDALIAGLDDPDPSLLAQRARSLALLAHGHDAIAALRDLPPSESIWLIRVIAHLSRGEHAAASAALAELTACARRASYLALAWVLGGRFAHHVPAGAVTPDDIARAIAAHGRLAEPQPADEPLDCAEIAIVAATAADDAALAAARTHALAEALDDRIRPFHHDLRAVVLTLPMAPRLLDFVCALGSATRAPAARDELGALAAHYLDDAQR